MARKGRGRRQGLRPEETLVSQKLTAIFDGVVVEQHDDGTEDGQYDLDVTGSIRAAVEVGQVTDFDIRRANAHWSKSLESHETPDLTRFWIFIFDEESSPGEPTRYPSVTRPAAKELTAALARLEARGVDHIGEPMDHATFELGGYRVDQDFAEVFRLLGRAAAHATSVDMSERGKPGGWTFGFGHGGVSNVDSDAFAAHVEALLHDANLADMRRKLDRSGLDMRIAALVFDSTTGFGWATGHITSGRDPSAPIELPAEITHVLVVGMNDLALTFNAADGWKRHETSGDVTDES